MIETGRLLPRDWRKADVAPFGFSGPKPGPAGTADDGGDFDHPAWPEGDTLRRHVLYRIFRPR